MLEKPLDYWQVNVVGTINLLSVMSKYGCGTLVFSSSATIYRTNNNQLINENQELEALNPYGNTKAVIEKLLEDL